MKRDMDLVRDILLAVEASEGTPFDDVPLEFSGRQEQEVSYHVQLLVEAGLVAGDDYSTMGNYEWVAQSLTWSGHEFLENIRDPEVWAKTKAGAKQVGGFGIDVIAALAKGFIKQKVKDHTGLDIEL